jgi:hypothetical protein
VVLEQELPAEPQRPAAVGAGWMQEAAASKRVAAGIAVAGVVDPKTADG